MKSGFYVFMSRICMVILLISTAAGATPFTSGFGTFSDDRANGWGQTFTPGVGLIEPEDLELPQTVYLLGWTYKTSDSGFGQTAGDVYLAIFSELDPDEMNASNLLGVSSTAVDMAAAGNGVLVTWAFDGIPLDKETQYALMFSSTPDASGIFRSQAVVMSTGDPYPGGGWIRVDDIANDWGPHYRAAYMTEGLIITAENNTLNLTSDSPSDSYNIILCGQPAEPVEVTVAPLGDDAAEVDLGAGPAQSITLLFAAMQSGVHTVTAVTEQVPIPGRLRSVTLVHTVESLDPDFHHQPIDEVIIMIHGQDPYCGQPGTVYLPGDLNRDCYVDLLDLAMMADGWMLCTDTTWPDRCLVP